jgi:hypothetical protein
MRKKLLNTYPVLGFFVIVLFAINSTLLAGGPNGPIIHIDPITYTFPTAFEGQTVSHDFVVANRGSIDLEIKDVTHQ